MKQYITPKDLSELSESQKMNLRDMWMPAVNTIVCASICKDVINEEYEDIVFVIGEIIVHEGSTNLILRRLRLVEDVIFEDELVEDESGDRDVEEEIYSSPDDIAEVSDEDGDLSFNGTGDSDVEDSYGDDEFEFSEPEQYFSREDCLPLLSIGEMIELLGGLKFGQDGFTVSIPSSKRLIGEQGYTVTNSVELEYEEDELCDALWGVLKEFL
ncbi:MAG: hypothetical protein PHC69_01860 [Ruminiclostridium sp.]|nr:hypothetical protein [Ruminiclostridium sp.]